MAETPSRNCLRAIPLAAALALLAWAGADLAMAQDSGGNSKAKRVGVVNADTWQAAQGLLPDEFLNRYKSGEWTHEIYEPVAGTTFFDRDFIEKGRLNEGRYAIGSQGHVIDVKTGKQPPFVYGPPFPAIDPEDPQAGAKVVWNFFYQSYLLGNSRNFVNLDWVGPRGLDRRLATDVYQRFFDGQPEKYRPAENPNNFLFQQLTSVTKPADLQGTVSLTHRFRDPRKRDQVWAFVPALRRVRQVSPANRSDGFLGSDMSQDDGSYFDGKPEDFEWQLVGDGEMLVLYDRTGLVEQQHNLRPLPDGGTEGRDSLRPRFAYQQGDWSGLPWRPLFTEFVLVKRPVWIVEGKPKDPYYLYGKLHLRFDKDSWRGTYNSKYDWQGQILNSYMPLYGPFFLIGGEWRAYAAALFTMSQNWKTDRATVSYADPQHPTYQSRIGYSDGLFNVDSLMRAGK